VIQVQTALEMAHGRDGSSGGIEHCHQGRGRGGLSPVGSTAAEGEEDRGAHVARTRSNAGYSRRGWQEKGPTGLLIGFAAENREFGRGSPAQLERQELRHGVVAESWFRKPAPASIRTKMKLCWCCERVKNIQVSRASKRCHRRTDPGPDDSVASRLASRRPMNPDQVRQYLSFYQDLGVKNIYRRKASEACQAAEHWLRESWLHPQPGRAKPAKTPAKPAPWASSQGAGLLPP